MEFNVEEAIENYKNYESLLINTNGLLDLVEKKEEDKSLKILEDVIIVDAVKKSNFFKEIKKILLVPTTTLKRIDLILLKCQNSMNALLTCLKQIENNRISHVKPENYVDIISNVYPHEIPGAVSAIAESKLHFNSLLHVVKKRENIKNYNQLYGNSSIHRAF